MFKILSHALTSKGILLDISVVAVLIFTFIFMGYLSRGFALDIHALFLA